MEFTISQTNSPASSPYSETWQIANLMEYLQREDGTKRMKSNAPLPNSNMCMVRAERRSIFLDYFLNEGVATIGWGDIGPIKLTDSTDDIRKRCAEVYPGDSNGWHQIKRFHREIEVGDAVVTYDRGGRSYHIGIVQSPAEHGPLAHGEIYPGYVRKVEWAYRVSRDDLSDDARSRLGGMLTVFQIPPSTVQELRHLISGEPAIGTPAVDPPMPVVESDGEQPFDFRGLLQEYIFKSDEFVEDQIARLNWQELQDLVAGILRAMGYRTRVSSPGADRGVDISASPDGLGLTEPRIFVEVKHRNGAIGSQAIRTFTGGRQDGDRCLYVSTGGFTRDARYEADRSRVPLTLLTMPDLRELLVNHYEGLDPETRALVPLKRVYWPVVE